MAPGWLGLRRQHALQGRHDRCTLRVRVVAARLPVIPGAEIHHRLGIERGDFVVVGKLLRDLRHFAGVGCVERRASGLRIVAVTHCERADQRLLAGARLARKCFGLLRGSEGRRDSILLHRKIDVGPEHQSLTPEAHGAVGIELLRHAEGTLRLAVIERVGKTQALVEIGLRAFILG